jgi:hypothetical protein
MKYTATITLAVFAPNKEQAELQAKIKLRQMNLEFESDLVLEAISPDEPDHVTTADFDYENFGE